MLINKLFVNLQDQSITTGESYLQRLTRIGQTWPLLQGL